MDFLSTFGKQIKIYIIMKIKSMLLIGALFFSTSISAQSNYEKDPESCTSIMVGKKATTDGSVITSHTCDSWYLLG